MVNVPMSLGWHQPAVRLLDEAVRLAPDYYDAWHYLGVCHGNLGNAAARIQRYDEARRQWTRALECFEKVLVLKHDHAEAAAYRDATRQRLDLLQEVQSLPSAGLP
jgi:tetratricopeptide (TPR) repeat protein